MRDYYEPLSEKGRQLFAEVLPDVSEIPAPVRAAIDRDINRGWQRPSGISYKCRICGEEFATAEQAIACANQGISWAGVAVGDIVIIPYVRQLLQIDHPWVVPWIDPNGGHLFGGKPSAAFAVVTSKHAKSEFPGEGHRGIVTLATRGVPFGLRVGWNPADGDGHYSMVYPGKPQARHTTLGGSVWGCAPSDPLYEPLPDGLAGAEVPDIVREQAAELVRYGFTSRSLF